MVYGVGARDEDLIERHGFDVSLPARIVPYTCFQQTVQFGLRVYGLRGTGGGSGVWGLGLGF